VAGSQTRSEHPGTAVEWAGEVYEVLAVEPLAGTAVCYRLAPWQHGHAIRRIEHYDEANEAARDVARVELHSDRNTRILAMLFSPVLGHLPGAVQAKMERDYGASARTMTFVSALPLFVLGALTTLAAQVLRFGGPPIVTEWMVDHSLLFTYLAVESALRIYSAWIAAEPMGSLFGFLAYGAWTSLRRRPAPPPAAVAPTAAPAAERALADRYTVLEPVLGLLAPADQEALEMRFGFDPLRWGRTTSLVIFFVAGANVLISVAAFRSGTDVFLDFAALVVGGFFVVEQVTRRRRLAEGKPAGSILGAIVRPFARPLLDSARS